MKQRDNIRNALLLFSIFLFLAGIGGIPSPATAQTGLVAYYPFNGNANDESGNGYHGTPSGGVTYTTDRFGNPNSAVSFNGTNALITTPELIFGPNTGVSVSLWVKANQQPGPTGTTYYFIMSESAAFGVWQEGNGIGLAISRPGTNSAWGTITFGTWNHFVGTYDGTTIRAYINGSLINETEWTGPMNDPNNSVTFGEFINYWWSGSLDDVRIYNRALTNGEIVQLYIDINGMIDTTKWGDLEFVREVVGETANKKLLSEVRAPNTNDATGSDSQGHTYRWANNSLNFSKPLEVDSIQAEVSVLRIIHTNPNPDTRAMLTGRWYSWYENDTQKGDIWAAVFLGATPAGGLEARWEVTKLTNPEGTTWVPINGGIFSTPVTIGESYTLYIKYDSDLNQFTFKIGDGTSWYETIPFSGLPPRNDNAYTPFKGLRTRVWLRGPTESGYISATFDNVKKNGVDYDNFDDPADMGMINKDRWNPWELVRRSNEGLIESALTRYFSNGGNSMSFGDYQHILGFEADLKVLEIQNSGAHPLARLYASLYNDGTGNDTPADLKGDIIASIGILEQTSNPIPPALPSPQAFYAVSRCLATNCNLPSEYVILTSGIFKSVALGDPSHRFSLSWNGLNVTFGCDGDVISYNPTILYPIGSGDSGLPKGRKGIGTRVSEIETNTNQSASVYATFGNVVITAIDTDDDGIDDAWEAIYCGGHCDPEELNANPDYDLLTNLQEYRYGTNPNIPDYKLTVTKSGTGDGTISRLPLGIDYAPSQYLYTTGTQVTLNATPAIGSYFVGWSGDCSGRETCIVTMDRARSVTAVFEITFTISGTVSHKVEGIPKGLEGVTMDGFPGTPPVTDEYGIYSGIVPYGWSGIVTPGKTGYTFIPDSTPYTNVIGNQTDQNYDALSAATTTNRDEATGGLKICSEFTDASGYPTKMYNCLDSNPLATACNCGEGYKEVWDFKPFSEIQVGLEHLTWVGPGPDPYSVDMISGSSTCVRRCYPSGYCYVGPPGCNPGTSGADVTGTTVPQTPLPPPAVTLREETIGDVKICSEPVPGDQSGCPTLVYSCADGPSKPWPTAEFNQITAQAGHITWVGIGSDPICPTVNIITASSTCVKRCYPSGYCVVGPPGCSN